MVISKPESTPDTAMQNAGAQPQPKALSGPQFVKKVKEAFWKYLDKNADGAVSEEEAEPLKRRLAPVLPNDGDIGNTRLAMSLMFKVAPIAQKIQPHILEAIGDRPMNDQSFAQVTQMILDAAKAPEGSKRNARSL